VFLLGKPETTPDYDGFNSNLEIQNRILNESLEFGDIIQEDFVDSYNNLTLKSVFLLKWVTNNCIDKGKLKKGSSDSTDNNFFFLSVKFLVKCDDDTFLNIPNLLHVLTGGTIPIYNSTIAFYDKLSINNKVKRNRLQTKNVLTGFLFCGVKPVSDPANKWYSPIYMYNEEFYPNYLSGTAYLMSIDVVEKLYKASLKTPLFHLEDVFITGEYLLLLRNITLSMLKFPFSLRYRCRSYKIKKEISSIVLLFDDKGQVCDARNDLTTSTVAIEYYCHVRVHYQHHN
jgi:hypothetical protein